MCPIWNFGDLRDGICSVINLKEFVVQNKQYCLSKGTFHISDLKADLSSSLTLKLRMCIQTHKLTMLIRVKRIL